MYHAEISDFETVKEIFYLHKKWFPHIRTDYMKRMIAKKNLILEKLPCTFERVRFMKLVAGKVIGKHSDKIDKDIESGNIVRIHVPIRTNEDVIFTLYENARDKIGNEHNLKTGHFYYTDVSKPHAVRNNSNIDRIHLVVDCHANSALRTLIA